MRVFRPLASESETLDWSRKERSRVVIGCRSACGNERCVAGWCAGFDATSFAVLRVCVWFGVVFSGGFGGFRGADHEGLGSGISVKIGIFALPITAQS